MKAGCSAFGYKKIERQQLLCTIWCQSFQVITKAIINRVLVFLERIGRQKYGMTALKDTKKSEFVYNYTTVCIVMWLLFITVSPYPFPHANGADDCLMFFPVLQIQWLCFFLHKAATVAPNLTTKHERSQVVNWLHSFATNSQRAITPNAPFPAFTQLVFATWWNKVWPHNTAGGRWEKTSNVHCDAKTRCSGTKKAITQCGKGIGIVRW